ncbi:MAG TPA: pyridoxal-dependent decarboxylase [Steroidobacteraceae bacterium]|nr:pyridoxal-dependent decarboxylase [Steroidobacteraceae bacterium]
MSEASMPLAIPAPVAALFPPDEERLRIGEALLRELLASERRIAQGPVTPTLDLQQLQRELTDFDFERPRPLEPLLRWTLAQLEQGLTHLTHPRYFGLFNPAPAFPAQLADQIAASFNPQLASIATSPAAVAIEAHVIAALARRAGLPAASRGHFTTSGSEANATALICALTRAEPRFGSEGVRAFRGAPLVYVSQDAQPGWFKVAHQCGIGRQALRLIATDGRGCLDADQLDRQLARDLADGARPVMIAATAGTTGAGMIDPLQRCAQLALQHGIWYHVDAAWAGALLCSARLRALLGGIEQADSLTIDAHKWFAATMGCGMFLTAHAAVAAEAFRVTADFMQSSSETLDPYLTTLQWSRRFMGLRLFLSLSAAGWQGYARHVERAVTLIEELARRLADRGWTVRNVPRAAVLCVAPPSGSRPVRDIVQRVLRSGTAWVAATRFEGEDAVRICATHGQSAEQDLAALIGVLEQAARTGEMPAPA